MSKETVKLYSHDGANITIAEIPKEDIDTGRLVGKYFTDYNECKEDRDLTQKINNTLHDGLRYDRAKIDSIMTSISDVGRYQKTVDEYQNHSADNRRWITWIAITTIINLLITLTLTI